MILIHDIAPFGKGNKSIDESNRFQINHVIVVKQLENIWNIRNINAYIGMREFKSILENLQLL